MEREEKATHNRYLLSRMFGRELYQNGHETEGLLGWQKPRQKVKMQAACVMGTLVLLGI